MSGAGPGAEPFQHLVEGFAGESIPGIGFLLLLACDDGTVFGLFESGTQEALIDQAAGRKRDRGESCYGKTGRGGWTALDPFHQAL